MTRLKILHGLDSLFRHYVLVGVAPLVGGLIAIIAGWIVWPEVPTQVLIYGFAGVALGTCLGIVGLRLLKGVMHPWVISRLAETKCASH